MENIPFLQAALVSDQNTFTHSSLTETPAFYFDSNEFNFHAKSQPF
jgi:hypothetical protein